VIQYLGDETHVTFLSLFIDNMMWDWHQQNLPMVADMADIRLPQEDQHSVKDMV
jgi:hypothetical protein